MSFIPNFDYLKPPSPDQTTMTQYLPRRSTERMGVDPPENNHDNDCDDPIPPTKSPTKPSPPNSPPQSTDHKKQPNYHKKKN